MSTPSLPQTRDTDNTAPRVTSITRQTPPSSPTAADSLTWRVTFNEAVQNVDAADFQISGTTASLTAAGVDGTNAYDVTASGGDLAGLTGTVTLRFVNGQNIEDSNGNALTTPPPRGRRVWSGLRPQRPGSWPVVMGRCGSVAKAPRRGLKSLPPPLPIS